MTTYISVIQVVLITGGNGGIGAETAKELLSRGAVVFIACRHAERAEIAKRSILDLVKHIPGLVQRLASRWFSCHES